LTTLDALNSISAVLRPELSGYLLEKAESQPGDERVPSNITVGYAPPRNADMSQYNQGYNAPCVIVGVGENGGSDDGKEASIPVMITVGTYSPGTTDEFGPVMLNNEGYIDLINLIERIRHVLLSRTVLKRTTIDRPVAWGMYPDQPYPYWYGWLSFDAKVAVEEMQVDQNNNFLTI
jgi:hypothetical protein